MERRPVRWGYRVMLGLVGLMGALLAGVMADAVLQVGTKDTDTADEDDMDEGTARLSRSPARPGECPR